MLYSIIVKRYYKAVRLYERGKLKRAKRIFMEIVYQGDWSDTDCMADIELCNSARSYLDKLHHVDESYNVKKIIIITVLAILLLSGIIYFMYNLF